MYKRLEVCEYTEPLHFWHAKAYICFECLTVCYTRESCLTAHDTKKCFSPIVTPMFRHPYAVLSLRSRLKQIGSTAKNWPIIRNINDAEIWNKCVLFINRESHTWALDWYRNRWPWMSLKDVMAVLWCFFAESGAYHVKLAETRLIPFATKKKPPKSSFCQYMIKTSYTPKGDFYECATDRQCHNDSQKRKRNQYKPAAYTRNELCNTARLYQHSATAEFLLW